MVRTLTKTRPKSTASDLAVLEAIQKRLLWLGTNIVHHANNVRENTDGTKVGGHQASTASSVSILTAVYFSFLKAGDRVAIKPHSSPAYHAIQYLLGNLDRKYLPTLREFGGLQAYPSRSKDPDPVDFSLGSMGLGAAAPSFAALAERYTRLHFGGPSGRRFVALLGDAELDEGNVWEAVTESHLSDLGNLTWVIDLNRQSLDRVVPGIRARQLKALFRDSNWNVIETKFGRRLRAAFSRAGGEALKRRIDNMTNPEYQAIIRLKGPECRAQMIDGADDANGVRRALADVPDNEVPALLSDLGGHDLGDLIAALAEADAETARPSVIFAYTIKGWGLPMAAHPLNHSALMNAQQMEDLAKALEIPPDDEWAGFEPDSPEGRLCAEVAERLREPEQTGGLPLNRDDIPISVDHQPLSNTSSQATLGLLLMDLSRIPAIANRIVTTTPDVAVSTNLGGWINKVGVYQATADKDYESGPLPVKWDVTPTGQHIELGISEMNLFVLLEQLGLSHELAGELLLPIGTVYDPFVLRGLDSFVHALYSDAKFVVAGTPAGVSLSPEGGAHQSTVTPALGIGLPNLISYEPTFAKELEWILLASLRECLDREKGKATYLRLSTKPIDQALLDRAMARLGEEQLRRDVLSGGYRLVDVAADSGDVDPKLTIQIAATGAIVPEAIAAAEMLHEEGVAANVLAITSADRLYAAMAKGDVGPLDRLIPPAEQSAPIVTVADGASHTLTFLGGVHGVPVIPLGVDRFGQSGTRADLYRYNNIDADAICAAAFRALEGG